MILFHPSINAKIPIIKKDQSNKIWIKLMDIIIILQSRSALDDPMRGQYKIIFICSYAPFLDRNVITNTKDFKNQLILDGYLIELETWFSFVLILLLLYYFHLYKHGFCSLTFWHKPDGSRLSFNSKKYVYMLWDESYFVIDYEDPQSYNLQFDMCFCISH